MNRSNTWKLIFTALITAISITLILPFEDRELGEYALSQVTSMPMHPTMQVMKTSPK